MPLADTTRFEAVRMRRESLYEALVGIEDALSTPIGDTSRWRLRVAMALDHAANRIDEHIEQTESPEGILQQVITDSPRLCHKADRLREDHEILEKGVHALRTSLAEIDDADIAERGMVIRNQAMEFLGQLALHRQRGADLLYEAYQVDIGASH